MTPSRLGIAIGSACIAAITLNHAAMARQAAPSSGLSSEQIQAAIEWGKTGNPKAYPATGNHDPRQVVAALTTPFLRVALAAYNAKVAYKAFAESDVTPELSEPTVHIIVYHYVRRSLNVGKGGEEAYKTFPEQILVLPKDSKDPSQAIQPISVKKDAKAFLLFGTSAKEIALIASFPLDVLTRDNEFVLIYEKPVFRNERELRVKGLCGRFTARGCVTPDKRDPVRTGA